MSLLVLALLSLLWLGFFLPSLLQARRTSSPYASATTFQDSLRRLSAGPEPTSDAPAAPRGGDARRAAAVAARRRETLAVLAAATVAGAAIAVGFGGWTVWLAPMPAAALAAYVVMLRREVVRRASARARSAAAPVTSAMVSPDPLTPPGDAAPSADAEIVPSVRRRSAAQLPERMAG